MSLDLDHPRLAPELGRLHPYLRVLLEAAGRRALGLHADEVTVEHLLGVCMEDEDCAAHALVLHAFADPGTLDEELLALSPGLMVVGSSGVLPFSPRAVEALLDTGTGGGPVTLAHLLAAALGRLPADQRQALVEAGLGGGGGPEPAPGGSGPAEGEGEGDPAGTGSLFAPFSDGAKGALAAACRGASAQGEASIGPAHLVLACVQADPDAHPPGALARARGVLAGHTADPSEPRPRRLPPHPDLGTLVAGLPAGADSLELLEAGRCAREEIAALLARHRITPELLDRARGAFRDPDPPRSPRG